MVQGTILISCLVSERSISIFSDKEIRGDFYPQLKPNWGLLEIAVVCILIALYTILFSIYGLQLSRWVFSLFPEMGDFSLAIVFSAGFFQSILLVLAVLSIGMVKKIPFTAFGFDNFSWKSLFRYGVIGGMGVFLLVTLIMSVIISLLPQPPQPQAVAELILNAGDWGQIFPLLVLVGICAPVSEELFFRGFIYPVLRNRWGVIWGILATSSLFSLIHFDLVRFIPLALGGVCLNIFCEKSKSLYPAIIAHSMWNSVMTLFIFSYNMIL